MCKIHWLHWSVKNSNVLDYSSTNIFMLIYMIHLNSDVPSPGHRQTGEHLQERLVCSAQLSVR